MERDIKGIQRGNCQRRLASAGWKGICVTNKCQRRVKFELDVLRRGWGDGGREGAVMKLRGKVARPFGRFGCVRSKGRRLEHRTRNGRVS